MIRAKIREESLENLHMTRVVYRIGIFRSVSVGIFWYLPYRYQRKTRSVQFGIKKRAIAPYFPQKGGSGPLFKELSPPFEEKRENDTKKGGTIPTENSDTEPIWYRVIGIPKKWLESPGYTTLQISPYQQEGKISPHCTNRYFP